MNIEIKKITVVTGIGMDHVYIETDLPRYEESGNENDLEMRLIHGTAADYVRSAFHIEPEIIDRTPQPFKFKKEKS